ncbi:hypothetical protein [Pseudoalteromonas sp.]|uniref:hypothetical protein n=1 Tax=Pseudoalteromonas sp. TaxID=53249 RepID=UPI003568683D
MTEANETSAGLFRFLIIMIVFSLLYWVLAGKMLTIYSDVEKVAAQKSKDDFMTSVYHIRHQWMRNKQNELLIQLVGQSELTSVGELKALVNENGFVIKVISSPDSQCEGLFENLQSIALSEIQSVEILERGQVIGCEYTKNSKILFKYLFLNGIVSNS